MENVRLQPWKRRRKDSITKKENNAIRGLQSRDNKLDNGYYPPCWCIASCKQTSERNEG